MRKNNNKNIFYFFLIDAITALKVLRKKNKKEMNSMC
jgi:hypothetical protein